MIKKYRIILKYLLIIFVMFFYMNVMIPMPVYADAEKIVLTIAKIILSIAEVGVSGWFTIRLTWLGIQYFMANAATDKAEMKNKVYWTFLYGVGAMVGIVLFARAAKYFLGI